MRELAPGVIFLTRADWGARTDLPRLGGPAVPRERRRQHIFHHTVSIDNDRTPLVFETLDEIRAWMRRLQTIRPDLGLDVPYNFVVFLVILDGKVCIVVCEGRGFDLWGAHTAGHDAAGDWNNGSGIASAMKGDFETYRVDVGPWRPFLNHWLWFVKQECPRVGELRPARAISYGHRDYAQTACPGEGFYAAIPTFRFERLVVPARPSEEEIIMEEVNNLRADIERRFNHQAAVDNFQNGLLVGYAQDLADLGAGMEFHGKIIVDLVRRNPDDAEIQRLLEVARRAEAQIAQIKARLREAGEVLAPR